MLTMTGVTMALVASGVDAVDDNDSGVDNDDADIFGVDTE